MLKRKSEKITTGEFDSMFERGGDIFKYLDFKKATVVRRVNVDFPEWMIEQLDKEAQKLNISRQAVVKTWIYERLTSHHA